MISLLSRTASGVYCLKSHFLVLGLVAIITLTVTSAAPKLVSARVGGVAAGTKHRFEIKSSAFKSGQRLPQKYTADGADISPPLSWTRPPLGTKTLLVIMFDPDAPGPMPFLHWVVFNIPPQVRSLAAHIPPQKRIAGLKGARQGKNSFGGRGYGGPAPPPGKPHHYHIEIYALNRKLSYAPDCFRCLQHAIAGHVLAQSALRVTYGR